MTSKPPSMLAMILSPPAAAALLLAVAALVRIGAAQPSPQIERYHAGVASVIDRFPYRIGSYVGTDAELSQPAVELLKPNRIVQRTFVNVGTGLSCSIVLVHCKDVRDMVGHYPPVCYQAHGWRLASSARVELKVDQLAMPAQRYRFTRSISGVDRALEMVNFFVVPRKSDCFVPDMDALNQLSAKPRERLLGSGQIQIIIPEGLPDSELNSFLGEILDALKPTMDAIAAGDFDG